MACRPPIKPKSTPYWKGDRTMKPHATKHRQFARIVSLSTGVAILNNKHLVQ
jgi:hypothetical protein